MKKKKFIVEEQNFNPNHYRFIVYEVSLFGYKFISYKCDTNEELYNFLKNNGNVYRQWSDEELENFMNVDGFKKVGGIEQD